MGKRTSDFLALAAILSGAGVGLGLTGLRAENGPASVRNRDESSVRVEVKRRIRVAPGNITVRMSPQGSDTYLGRYLWRRMGGAGPDGEHFRVMIRGEELLIDAQEMAGRDRERLGARRMQLEGLRAQMETLRRRAEEAGDSEAWVEMVAELEALESLDLGESLRFEVRRGDGDEDQRRRRRRRPRRVADAPDADAPGN
jgi:hypothetical protein